MSDFDNEFVAAWNKPLPPVQDAVFRIAVLSRIERRRFRRRMTALLAAGFAAFAVAMVFAPQLDNAAVGLSDNSVLMLVGLAFVISTGWGLSRAFRIRFA